MYKFIRKTTADQASHKYTTDTPQSKHVRLNTVCTFLTLGLFSLLLVYGLTFVLHSRSVFVYD